MATQGGPAKSVSVQTGGQRQGGPAIPIAVVSDGRAVEGGPAMPIYLVTSGPVQGGPALPVVAVAAGARVAGGPAVPAYVVAGSFGAATPPSNTAAPVISGTANIGQLLTTTDGIWTGTAPLSYTYQWKRGGVAIGGATANTYTTVLADSGTTITCTVTATNASGSASATSNGLAIFTPAGITGLQTWYKADALVLNNNDPVVSWPDSSGNGNNAVQGTGANQPTYKTNVQNGLPAVLGDGVSDYLRTANIAHNIDTGDIFYAAVIKMPGAMLAQAICDLGADAPLLYFSGANKPDLYLGGDHVFTGVLSVDTWYTIIVRRVAGTFECWVNGTQDATTFALGSTVGLNTPLTLFGEGGGSSALWWSSYIADDLFGKTLSNADMTSLVIYLRVKYAHY